MTSKSNKSINASHLLDMNAYGGWLRKRGNGKFGSGYLKRYCIVHDGAFYYFKDHSSKSAKGVVPLSGVRVVEMKQSKGHKWGFALESSNNHRRYKFEVPSQRDQETWISQINQNIVSHYRTTSTRSADDTQDDDSGSDSSSFSYDYADFTPPIDVSFVDPERIEKPVLEEPMVDPNLVGGFYGPKLGPKPGHFEQPVVPVPPPRLKPNGNNYEVTLINAPSKITAPSSEGHYEKMLGNVEGNDVETKKPLIPPKSPKPRPHVLSDNSSGLYESQKSGEIERSDALVIPDTVYQWKLERKEAEKSLSNIGAIGLYLIRCGKDERHVLSVFAGDACRHYIIFVKNNKRFIGQDPEPQFYAIGDLIRYYMTHDLPTCNVRLSRPYR